MSDLGPNPPDPIVPTDPVLLVAEHNYDAWIGRYVYLNGRTEPVGTIADIFYDVDTERPEWLVLDPDDHIVPLAPGPTISGPYDDLYLAHTPAEIAAAPTLSVAGVLTVDEEQALYEYWGFDWQSPAPDPLPARFDDGWDTNFDLPRPTPQNTAGRMVPFVPVVTPPPPPPAGVATSGGVPDPTETPGPPV